MNRRRILSTFIKESILLLSDIQGLMMLFVMPLVLIIVMAIIQDIPFKDYQDVQFDILYVDDDKKPLSDSLFQILDQSTQFNVIHVLHQDTLTHHVLKSEIETGNYSIGIYIPKGTYAEMANKTNRIVNELGKSMGNPAIIPVRSSVDSIQVALMFDPATKNTFRLAVKNAIESMLFKVQFNMLISKITNLGMDGDHIKSSTMDMDKVLANSVKEINTGKLRDQKLVLNSVQHNVPAWIVFAIFFLILPLAGNYIKEQESGSKIRIMMTPGSYLDILAGKSLLYCLVSILQFCFLILMSQWLLPYFNLPILSIDNPGLIIIAAIPISFAAISLGYLIGSFFKTHHQAMMFGAILVILMSALGGIWIPIEVLPHWMQELAKLSPLHWALSLVNDVFLRGTHWQSFLYKSAFLITFGSSCLILALALNNKKRRSK